MSEQLRVLRQLSEDELIRQHDRLAENTQVSVNHYLAELARRDQDKQTTAMLRYTLWITVMTAIILISTIVQVAASVIK